MVLIGLPAALIGLVLIWRLWRDAGEEARLAAAGAPQEARSEGS